MKNLKIYAIIVAVFTAFVLIMTGCSNGDTVKQKYFSIDELKAPGTVISMWLGCGYEEYKDEAFPDAETVYGAYVTDLALNIRQDKADAMILSEPFFNYFADSLSDMVVLEGDIGKIPQALIFSKAPMGSTLLEKFNSYLSVAKADGTLDELQSKWLDINSEAPTIDMSVLDADNEHIRAGVALDEPPFSFISNDEMAGFDVDLFVHFCEYYEYYPDFMGSEYEGLVTAVQTDKYDVIMAGYEISEEREKSVSFSDVTVEGRVLVIVQGEPEKQSFIESFKTSFRRTFIEENRYKSFVKGIGVTMLISVASVLLGTIIGFVLFLLNRDKKKGITAVINVITNLLNRIPTIVWLMILFYVVFGKSSIDAIFVSILLFMFVFGLNTYESLLIAADSVGKGQIEAAFTLGFTRNETFFKILLPQGRPIFMSDYKNNIVNILLESSVVGYITVSDLTRVGDIIRNNTYEAFFPLIAVAIFYLILSTLIMWLVDYIQKKLMPSNRTDEEVLEQVLGNEYNKYVKNR